MKELEKGRLGTKVVGYGIALVDIEAERKHSRKIWEYHVMLFCLRIACLSARQIWYSLDSHCGLFFYFFKFL